MIPLVEVPPATHRPAVVDGRLVWLPLLPALVGGARGFSATGGRALWSTVAAASLARPALEHLDRVGDVRRVFPDAA
jgi:hypothetical protein